MSNNMISEKACRSHAMGLFVGYRRGAGREMVSF